MVMNENVVEVVNGIVIKNLSPSGQMKKEGGDERIPEKSRESHGCCGLPFGEHFVEGDEKAFSGEWFWDESLNGRRIGFGETLL